MMAISCWLHCGRFCFLDQFLDKKLEPKLNFHFS